MHMAGRDPDIMQTRFMRYCLGMSDAELAETEGVSRAAVSAWRRWRNLPPNKPQRTRRKRKAGSPYVPFPATSQWLADFRQVWRRRPRCAVCGKLIRGGQDVKWRKGGRKPNVVHVECENP